MRRRTVLQTSLIGAVVGTAGCLSSLPGPFGKTPTPSALERCSNRKNPERHLGIILLNQTQTPDGTAPVIRYGELSSGERELVDAAIERERLAICLPNAPGSQTESYATLVNRIQDHTESTTDGPYLRRNGTYYQFTHVRTRDQVFVTATG